MTMQAERGRPPSSPSGHELYGLGLAGSLRATWAGWYEYVTVQEGVVRLSRLLGASYMIDAFRADLKQRSTHHVHGDYRLA